MLLRKENWMANYLEYSSDQERYEKRGLPIVSMQQKCLGSSLRMHLTNLSLLGLFPAKE